MGQETYTISELADAAGVTPRTIRYYVTEGLLPQPDMRGKYALYTNEHLQRLELIGRLKDAYLPLSEIRARLEQLSVKQVKDLLASDSPEPSDSAADYITRALASKAQSGVAEAPASYGGRGVGPDAGRFEQSVPFVEERWRRIQLMPGVELHIRESLEPRARSLVDRLIAFARGVSGTSSQ